MGFDMNYKIKVANEVENKEAQELFFELDYSWPSSGKNLKNLNYRYLILLKKGSINWNTKEQFLECDAKEITLPELRDLVVLKRNDIRDSTHVGRSGSQYYDGSDFYFWNGVKWVLSIKPLDSAMKPIEKKEMKEYLRKNSNGKYIAEVTSEQEASEPHAADWIEIPEGAFSLKENFIFFNQDSSKFYSSTGEWLKSPMTHQLNILWQRESPNDKLASAEQYRQAEVLPFIDDEPKIETATGYQLDIVGQNTYGSRSRNDGESDISYRQYLMNFIIDCKSGQSLNDQYAEIENVRRKTYGLTPERAARISLKTEGAYLDISDTLKQRESTYGSFQDVAFVTQGMIELMRKCNYDKMPAPHQMALSMIASKMARIINGDFNHKDSWHDIGGYAKLIENLIEVEDEKTK